jgi:hypothetical protein
MTPAAGRKGRTIMATTTKHKKMSKSSNSERVVRTVPTSPAEQRMVQGLEVAEAVWEWGQRRYRDFHFYRWLWLMRLGVKSRFQLRSDYQPNFDYAYVVLRELLKLKRKRQQSWRWTFDQLRRFLEQQRRASVWD